MKRFLSLLLVVVMVFSLVACASTEDNNGQQTVIVEEKYDENGNILIEPLYMGWNLWYYNSYTYHADQKIEKVERFTDTGLYLEDERYFYRADGTLEKIECYWENLESEIELFQEKLYDESGVLYKIQNYENGAIYDYYVFEYDNGNCVKETLYRTEWGEEQPYSYTEFAYDDVGNCIRKDQYESSGRVYYCIYSYDSNGRVATELKYQELEGEEYAAETIYTYHSNGRVKNKVLTDLGLRWEETWDERGGMVCDMYYELSELNEWVLKYKVEYTGDLKVYTTYHEDGRYNTETMKGNALVTTWSERAYYNSDGTLFCTNSDGVFYDPSGEKMEDKPDLLAPWGIE